MMTWNGEMTPQTQRIVDQYLATGTVDRTRAAVNPNDYNADWEDRQYSFVNGINPDTGLPWYQGTGSGEDHENASLYKEDPNKGDIFGAFAMLMAAVVTGGVAAAGAAAEGTGAGISTMGGATGSAADYGMGALGGEVGGGGVVGEAAGGSMLLDTAGMPMTGPGGIGAASSVVEGGAGAAGYGAGGLGALADPYANETAKLAAQNAAEPGSLLPTDAPYVPTTGAGSLPGTTPGTGLPTSGVPRIPGVPAGGGTGTGTGGSTIPALGDLLRSGIGLADAQKLIEQAKAGGESMNPFDRYRRAYGDELKTLMATPNTYDQQLQHLEANPGDITKLPGYEAGLTAVERSQAAGGYLGSGNMMAALQQYGGNAFAQREQFLSSMSLDNATTRRESLLAGLAGAGAAPGAGAALTQQGMQNAYQLQGQAVNSGLTGVNNLLSGPNSPLNWLSGQTPTPGFNGGNPPTTPAQSPDVTFDPNNSSFNPSGPTVDGEGGGFIDPNFGYFSDLGFA